MAERSSAPAHDPASTRILVVDDDRDHVELLCEILRDAGYSVEGVCDGRAALARLRQGPRPDLITLDLIMPEMDGWQFVAELKATPALAEIPVVTVSGAGERVLSSAPVSAGYVAKPVDPNRLRETIESCLFRRGKRPTGALPAT
jgi:CheY-like chemotaxis protein